MDRLAKGVGVSRATVYNYFADRDAVVEFVEERTFAPLLESLEEIAAADRSPSDKMRAMAHEVFARVYDNRALVVALIPEKHVDAHREGQLGRRNRGRDCLVRAVREGVDNGISRDLPPALVSEIFLGAVTGMVDTMVFNDEFRKPEEVVPTLMEVFLGGLRL